ncbi:MAG: glycosyltransferase family 2 protein [Xylanivirga thermophila]|jgi:glycosyltransferase involved in cell wall biosynthesis|uniref:glycosyltransferase family 2 protein n=1 Tax=Xylanivirga thermophila TaxID=2496273 RepID=UPI00101D4582|nr:glycosyltransferase family 2 protein [Xylanivirga thermophila]
MKLIIQIPCYNEEKTLPMTIGDLPTSIPGVDEIEYLIIDDGSSDRTVEVARKLGVHHIVRFPNNRGLAKGFMAGIDACLRVGADIIVNTDGDNQYNGHDIPKLIKPILDGKAEVVVGDRQTDTIEHFSPTKKKLQRWGSGVVRRASKTNVADAPSGFRAYSREAALKLNVISEYSYTLETLIEAGRRKEAIANVPIGTNEKLRESRLFKSMWQYVRKSGSTIIRTYTMYKPLKIFLNLGFIMFLIGFIIGCRYLYFFFNGEGAGHVQSLILAAINIITGFQLGVLGLLADGIAANRRINDELLYRLKKMEYDGVVLRSQGKDEERKEDA